jgi:uncharacterized protein
MSDHHQRTEKILGVVADWAGRTAVIRGIALAGSRARGEVRPDSDVDLIVLTPDPGAFRDSSWVASIAWSEIGEVTSSWQDQTYGVAWSRHLRLAPDFEVEFCFAAISWADIDPIDPGTLRVVSDGCCILYDPDGSLSRVCMAAKR